MGLKYAKILNDDAFKVVVCAAGNEPLLTKIVQLLLPELKVSGLKFADKEQHGLVVSDKNVTFDMLCTTEDDSQFIVELQSRSNASYPDRMLSYATYPIRMQLSAKLGDVKQKRLKNGMDYSLLPVYVISLVDFKLKHDSTDGLSKNGLVSRYSLRNDFNSELMTDALHFIYLEMGRLDIDKSHPEQCTNVLEQLVWSVKYMHEVDERPANFTDELLTMLYGAAELANMTIDRRTEYDLALMQELDQIIRRDMDKKESREQGLAEGRAEGQKAFLEKARAMAAEGKSIDELLVELENI